MGFWGMFITPHGPFDAEGYELDEAAVEAEDAFYDLLRALGLETVAAT